MLNKNTSGVQKSEAKSEAPIRVNDQSTGGSNPGQLVPANKGGSTIGLYI